MTVDARVSRRDLLGLALATTFSGALALSGCRREVASRLSPRQVNIYSWADYLDPATIPEFERRYGIRVVYDTFASNEALLAKLQAGAASYDVVVPTSYMLKHFKRLGLLQTLDKERLPNFRFLIDRFRNPAYDPHCEQSVPYTWGTTGIGYNRLAFASARAGQPGDWGVFWDSRLSGRMTLLDDAREVLGMALKRRGYSYNTVDLPLIRQACADMIQQKPLNMCYTSDQAIIYLSSGDSLVSLIFSGDAYQAQRENPQVGYVIPESGASLWVDNMCIPKLAPHPENAYRWINFMLEPEVAAATANYTRYATPNAAALKRINPELLSDKNLYPSEAVLSRCDEIADIGPLIFYYDRMWTELKCA